MNVPAQARAFRAATILAGAAVVVAAALQAPRSATATLALLLAGVVLAELLQVSSEAYDDVETPTFSFSSAIHLAAVLLLGPWAAVLVAAFGVVTVDRLRGSRWNKVAFNAAGLALAALGGGLAFTAAGGTIGSLSLPADFLPLAALALGYSVTNTVLVTVVIALHSGTPIVPALREAVSANVGSSTAEAALGVLLTLCALHEPWAVVAVVPLVVAAYQAHARHALLRRETEQALQTFAHVIDERDPGTYRHSDRVAEHVRDLARALRLPASEVARLEAAGRLHDLGKVAVDAAVLRKEGKLDGEEWATMRRHPRLSARLLRSFRFAAGQAQAVEYHHERYDGRGYYGIGKDTIPLAAHFLTVADTFDAMCSDRPYRKGFSKAAALREIEANSGTQFHPAVARAFVALQLGRDPVAAISPAEYAELRRLSLRPARGRRMPDVRPELVAALGLSSGLAAIGFGNPAGAVAGLVVAALALGLHRLRKRRSRVLASGLALVGTVDELVDRLRQDSPLRWAGIVDWRERELTGSLVRASGEIEAAPTETALTSWLIREADDQRLLSCPGKELGAPGCVAALPVRRDGAVVAYLVLAFERPPPRHVGPALRAFDAGPLAPGAAGNVRTSLAQAS